MKCVLTIAGSDPSGGAGIQNDLKTIAAHGLHGASCITTVTVQNTRGIIAPSVVLDPDLVGAQIRAVADDLPIASVKVGLLGSAGVSRAVAEVVETLRDVPLVLDPVIRSGHGQDLLTEDPISVLEPLLPLCSVLTPNVMEAEMISGGRIGDPDQAGEAATKILSMGAEAVVIKGGHLREGRFTDVLVTPGQTIKIPGREAGSGGTHGSGCTFSTALACGLALEMELEEATRHAKRFTEMAIADRLSIGAGNRPVGPLVDAIRHSALFKAVEQVARAASQIEAEPGFGRLVPQVGMNIAHAPKGCRGIDDVVGLTGRIVLVSGRPRSTGCPMAGGSSHMGRMALALRRQTETLGACMNVRYGEETMKAAAAAGLKAAEFERSSEPPGADTMSWGLRRALESVEGTPDIVYDLGAPGKEGMIRILGVDPDDAIRKARRILDAIE